VNISCNIVLISTCYKLLAYSLNGKCVPEGKSKPSRKCTATDLQIKIRMLCNYKGQQSLSLIACELGFAVSTVNTIVKDTACIKDHVKAMTLMKSTIITKKCENAVNKLVKLLTT
jgi:hypothetical protein